MVETSEAVAAGVSGAFYWDQLGPDLLSIIDRLALRGSSKPEVHSTGAYRIASGRRGDRVSADAAMLRGQTQLVAALLVAKTSASEV